MCLRARPARPEKTKTLPQTPPKGTLFNINTHDMRFLKRGQP